MGESLTCLRQHTSLSSPRVRPGASSAARCTSVEVSLSAGAVRGRWGVDAEVHCDI